ncbi:hypothetical protein DL96DRAFT_1811529 [Flagelloscypha sp. PMI_526]|nr:hypothetical protein DL96DRAFT_1811529 [Flagelloscypha sp. PMI_526]
MSPVDQLPAELLQSIFLLLLPQTLDVQSQMLTSLDLTPVQLSHVNRAWFSASTQFPRLWRRLADRTNYPTGIHSGLARVYFTRLFLQNSSNDPLEVIILPSTNLPQVLSEYDHTCLQDLDSHVHRFESFLCDSYYLSMFHISSPTPLLRTVELVGPGMHGSKFSTLTSFLLQSPLLQALVLDTSPRKVAVPWKQIRHLVLRYQGSVSDLQYSNSEGAPLETLSMIGVSSLISDAGLSPVTLPRLRELHVTLEYGQTDVVHLLTHLDLPALEKLGVCEPPKLTGTSFVEPEPSAWGPILCSRIADSGCPLKTLIFDSCKFNDEFLLDILRCTEHLQNLKVICTFSATRSTTPITSQLFHQLRAMDTTKHRLILVPELKSLDLTGPTAVDLTADLFENVAALRRLRVHERKFSVEESDVGLLVLHSEY